MSRKRKNILRQPFDFYPTPTYCVHRFLEKANIPLQPNACWLEPCAGDGSIIKSVASFKALDKYEPSWIANEIQPRFENELKNLIGPDKVIIDDFFSLPDDTYYGPQVIITNPPYNQAINFITKSMQLKPDYICMLLRVNFLGSNERQEFLSTYTPDIYVLPNRPSFDNKGNDATEYAWFVWRKENLYGQYKSDLVINVPKLTILNVTPKSERLRSRSCRQKS